MLNWHLRPQLLSKIAATLGGVGALNGAPLGAIGNKNVVSNLTTDIGKNTYINLKNRK